MPYLISVLYRGARYNCTNMLVGCIDIHLVSITILVHLCVGMVTLVTPLSVLGYKYVSI
jgi:hypothetical protein